MLGEGWRQGADGGGGCWASGTISTVKSISSSSSAVRKGLQELGHPAVPLAGWASWYPACVILVTHLPAQPLE